MALGSSVPPWLNVGPTDYLRAIQAGTATGLQVAEAQNRAQEAAARRAMAQQESQRQAWEFGERMRLAAEENARQGEYQQGMLDWRRQQVQQDMARAAQGDQLAQARLAEMQRHNLATETISQNRAEALARTGKASIVEHPEAPGMKFLRNPSGAETPIIRPAKDMTLGQKAQLTLSGLRSMQQGTFERATDPMYQMRTNYVGGLLKELGTLSQLGSTNAIVTTKSEYDALPSGAIYTGKDGKRYRKP